MSHADTMYPSRKATGRAKHKKKIDPAKVGKAAHTVGAVAKGLDAVLSFIPGVGSVAHAALLGVQGGASLVEKGAGKVAAMTKHKKRRAKHKERAAKEVAVAAVAKHGPDHRLAFEALNKHAKAAAHVEAAAADAADAVEAVEAVAVDAGKAASKTPVVVGAIALAGLAYLATRKGR